jgi:hypothetical protein
MNNSFITFIVTANFLDDQDLLLTVDSIRQQTEMCWMLEVRVVDIPDLPTITAFTHDNPRISVSEQSIKGNDDCQSTAIAVIPKGLELLPNACSEIKKAFEAQMLDIVVSLAIFAPSARAQDPEVVSQVFQSFTSIRVSISSKFPLSIGETQIPIAINRGNVALPLPIEGVGQTLETRDHEIRAKHLSELESQILVLGSQLDVQTQHASTAIALSQNLKVAKQQITSFEAQLVALHNSRTWKVGRLMLFPIRSFKKLRQRFSRVNDGV